MNKDVRTTLVIDNNVPAEEHQGLYGSWLEEVTKEMTTTLVSEEMDGTYIFETHTKIAVHVTKYQDYVKYVVEDLRPLHEIQMDRNILN